MIDLVKLASADKEDDLKEIKVWLFQENVRLQNERKELEESRDRFIKERAQFRDEMNSLNHRLAMERKRIKDENLFFEKKMQILQDGFRQLESDRRKFETDKLLFESKKKNQERENQYNQYGRESYRFSGREADVADVLFSGVNNPLGLKKRYRDLIKIFHPDNMCGDANVIQMINQVYEKKKNNN